MKKFVKILVIILVVALVGVTTVSFAGCDDSEVLYAATNAEFPPFGFFDREGKMTGFDVEYINAIGAQIGMKVKMEHMNFDPIVGEIQNKKNYVGIAGMTFNADRLQKINFTKSYFQSYQVYIVADDDTGFDACTTAEEANEIASTRQFMYAAMGRIGQYFISGNDDYYGIGTCNTLPTINECIQKIVKDKSFAVADVTVAKEIVKNLKGFKVIDIPLTNEEYAIGVNKENVELLNKINAAIVELEANGTTAALKAKWLQNGIEK